MRLDRPWWELEVRDVVAALERNLCNSNLSLSCRSDWYFFIYKKEKARNGWTDNAHCEKTHEIDESCPSVCLYLRTLNLAVRSYCSSEHLIWTDRAWGLPLQHLPVQSSRRIARLRPARSTHRRCRRRSSRRQSSCPRQTQSEQKNAICIGGWSWSRWCWVRRRHVLSSAAGEFKSKLSGK